MILGRLPVNYPWYLPKEGCGAVRSFAMRGEFAAAIAELQRLATLGSQAAQAALGYLYLRGSPLTPRDLSRARACVGPGVQCGYAYAEYVMGWVAFLADKDAVPAVRYWRSAAKRGFGPAALEIGRFFATDLPGKPPAVAEAIKAFRLAGHLGHRVAPMLCARLLASGGGGSPRSVLARLVLPFHILSAAVWMRIDPFAEANFMHYEEATRPLFVVTGDDRPG